MKKYILILCCAFFAFSCEDYLDKAPDAGLQDDDVFTKYANFKSYFEAMYFGTEKASNNSWYNVNIRNAYPLWISYWDQKTTFDGLTEIADAGRRFRVQDWKAGQMGTTVNMMTTDLLRRPILKSMFKVIRICNFVIANADRVQDIDEAERNDMIAQAYFNRGHALFHLNRMWGPMPYITWVIGDDPEDWDLPRPTRYQSYKNVTFDMDSAFMFFEKASVNSTSKIRRDPGPGKSGHLADPLQDRPSGIAAKALKARALLYAASPLNNAHGEQDWADAAAANWEALQLALSYEYELLEMKDYSKNFLNGYQNEHLFAWTSGNKNRGSAELQGILSGAIGNYTATWSGECPTQSMVDLFEVKKDGVAYPLSTSEERDAATTAGAYNEQNPYINRDPRFANNIIYNQSTIVWTAYSNKAQIWYEWKDGVKTWGEHRNESKYQGCTRTGYYAKKQVGNISGGNTSLNLNITDALIRLGELYLNYAEAANEAYGPQGAAPGATLTAEQAINAIRNRAEMPDIDAKYLADKATFRRKIKAERTVELCFEGFHHYFDIRRWMDAPALMSQTLTGMDVEKVPTSAQYPTGFRYTRNDLPLDRQSRWKDAMYFIPFDTDDYYKMKVFDTSLNPAW